MNLIEELEKLASLKDQGHLSDSEFEKAKAQLLSQEKDSPAPENPAPATDGRPGSIPGLGLAIGVFIGNLVVVSIASGDILRGFAVGSIAAVLVMAIYLGMRAVKGGGTKG